MDVLKIYNSEINRSQNELIPNFSKTILLSFFYLKY